MIIVQIINGFGNQLFQYATARQLAAKHGVGVKLDLTAFGRLDHIWKFQLDCFECDFEVASEEEIYQLADPYIFNTFGYGFTKRLLVEDYRSVTHFLERSPLYDAAIESLSGNHYLEGYFQSDRYVCDIRGEMLKEFKALKPEVDRSLLSKIRGCNSIALHVRRGDYATNLEINKTYGVASLEYYQKAVHYLRERLVSPELFIFSNDINWCKKELQFDLPTTYVSGSFEPPVDFFLMSACNHFVIANSTFSWWAAYLGDCKDKIVIEPERFFADFSHKFPGIPEPDLSVNGWVQM